MKCVNCNNEIDNNSNFCGFCGCKINNINNNFNTNSNFNVNNTNNFNVNSNVNNNYMNNNINQNNGQIVNNNMNQNNNLDFKTWEGAVNLFRSVNCIGRENCIFLTFINGGRAGAKYGVAGGIGGLVGAGIAYAVTSSIPKGLIQELENYEGLLMNQTENGIGIIPLTQKGVQMFLNADKLYPLPDRFIFIPNQFIAGVEIKNYNMFNRGMQKVNIKLTDGNVIHQVARLKEKNVIYQEREFGKFVSRYKNK